MMYSLNFDFWSSVSFFSPNDVTSGFTGSGGFSLLWGPFVQPCQEKSHWVVLTNNEQSGQYSHSKNVAVNAYENNRQWRLNPEESRVWIKTERKTYSNAEEV